MHHLHKSLQIEAVNNKSLAETEHNGIARMLRNGLTVVGFAALEDFIKNRTSDALSEIGSMGVLFTELPEKLQNAATHEAIAALKYQIDLLEKTDKMSYMQEQSKKIASTATSNFEITPYAFGFSTANISDTIVGDILKSFNVEDPWREIGRLASRLNLPSLQLSLSFKNAARRRHKAAHVAHTDIPINDIDQFVKEAMAIAIGFDCLLSQALNQLKQRNRVYILNQMKISSIHIKFRTIKKIGRYWKDCVEGKTRAAEASSDPITLSRNAKSRAANAKQVLVEYDMNNMIAAWDCH